MLILAIESATDRCGCAIGDGHRGVLAAVESDEPRHHGELLVPQVQTVCQQAGTQLQTVEAVAVDIGPGLYTGLRVGVTTAITIATALRVPVITATSLDLLAYAARHTPTSIAAVLDARRGEVFWALYSPDAGISTVAGGEVNAGSDLNAVNEANTGETVAGGLRRLTGPAVDRPEAAAASIAAALGGHAAPSSSHTPTTPAAPPAVENASEAGAASDQATRHHGVPGLKGKTLLVGDAALAHGELLASVGGVELASEHLARPLAAELVMMASELAERGQVSPPGAVTPMYLRRPDAKPNPNP